MIADAYVSDGGLIVYDCAMRRFEVRFDRLEAFAGFASGDLRVFDVDEDGSFIHWPTLDLHVNLEMIREAIDPEYKARRLKESDAHHRRYGRAIAALRRRQGLRQTDFEGLSERHLRRIEGGAPINQAVLEALASGHGMTLEAYLDELAEQMRQ